MAVGVNFNDISIHALLAESDHDTYVIMEATKVISIHALLAESDFFEEIKVIILGDFYPRSPCGERLHVKFLFPALFVISIHALLAESDVGTVRELQCILDFYPRSPCGERP